MKLPRMEVLDAGFWTWEGSTWEFLDARCPNCEAVLAQISHRVSRRASLDSGTAKGNLHWRYLHLQFCIAIWDCSCESRAFRKKADSTAEDWKERPIQAIDGAYNGSLNRRDILQGIVPPRWKADPSRQHRLLYVLKQRLVGSPFRLAFHFVWQELKDRFLDFVTSVARASSESAIWENRRQGTGRRSHPLQAFPR